VVTEPKFAFKIAPQKRCDVCLVRRAKIRKPAVETIKRLQGKIKVLEKRIVWKEKRKREVSKEQAQIVRFVEAIGVIRKKGYAELCVLCVREPRIVLVRYIANKVMEVPDSLCMDCPMMFNDECRFGKDVESAKEQRRRDTLYKKCGKLLLCV
jgi:hypothetical protein